MTILAIDTSTDYLSLAVTRDGKTIARFHRKSRMRHSTLLVPMIDKLLKKAHLKPGSVDCFAISVGPGSFTGLRIGVTTVKGLAFALGKPIVAVPTLDVIAINAKNFNGIVCPVLDARKNKVYACLYKSDGKEIKRISGYLLLPVKELLEKTGQYNKIIFLGDAVSLIHPGVECSHRMHTPGWNPRAEIVARLGAELFKKRKFVTAKKLEPLYLYSRECDIKGI